MQLFSAHNLDDTNLPPLPEENLYPLQTNVDAITTTNTMILQPFIDTITTYTTCQLL